MVKAVIFDCFGVLVGRGFDETYRHAGGDPQKDRPFIEQLLGQANRGQISQAEFRTRITQRLDITNETYERVTQEVEQPNYELLQYIKQLRQKYKTAVLSNVNIGVLERKITASWLEQCFDALVVSAEEGFIKPEPEIYTLAAQRLQVRVQDCVFIDDKPGYVQAAQTVGMQGIVYDDFVQLKNDLEAILTKQGSGG